MKLKRAITVFTLAALLGSGSIIAFADSATKTDEQEAQLKLEKGIRSNVMGKLGLGKEGRELTEEEITELKTKREEALKKALEEGKITQEEYDEMINCSLNDGKFKFKGLGLGREKRELTEEEKAELKTKRDAYLKEALDDGKITEEEYNSLKNAPIEAGRGRIGREKRELTEEEKAELKTKREEALKKALEEGRITQDEYDKKINQSFSGKMKFGGKGACKF